MKTFIMMLAFFGLFNAAQAQGVSFPAQQTQEPNQYVVTPDMSTTATVIAWSLGFQITVQQQSQESYKAYIKNVGLVVLKASNEEERKCVLEKKKDGTFVIKKANGYVVARERKVCWTFIHSPAKERAVLVMFEDGKFGLYSPDMFLMLEKKQEQYQQINTKSEELSTIKNSPEPTTSIEGPQ